MRERERERDYLEEEATSKEASAVTLAKAAPFSQQATLSPSI